jgi:exo-beta-1,3-glucanase (GH17 family)
MAEYWKRMRKWSSENRVKIYMFEAFDEPWKLDKTAEEHYGWWNRPENSQESYIEKSTGRRFP